jgi:hypothetical protein
MGKWGKWVLLFIVAMAFAIPAWAVDFKLGGKYEIQGRYYANPLIKDIHENLTFPTKDMYLKHYLNFYPQIIVNDKIKIVGDLEVFDNKISRDDEVNYDGIYQSYNEFVPTGAIVDPGDTGSKLNTRNYKPYSQYNTFTVDQFYADVTTNIGKFILGKTTDFSGIGWFIQVPAVKDWTFGLVWNKKQEWSSSPGTVNDNNMGDQDEFEGIAKLENAKTKLDMRLAYKYSGSGHAQTRIWYPHLWFNQKFSDLVKMNMKLGFGNGILVNTDSPVGQALEDPDRNWSVDKIVAGWLGFGITPGNATIQIDGAYLPGARNPYNVSAYLDDGENLDAWLMNDVHDIYAFEFETYATQAALGDPRVDGNYSFSNALLLRLNLGFKFTEKLSGDLNFVTGQKEDINYLQYWFYKNNDYDERSDTYSPLNQTTNQVTHKYYADNLANAVRPDELRGVISYYYAAAPDANGAIVNHYVFSDGSYNTTGYISDVNKGLGWELRGRLNYKWMDNLSFGIDLAYYKPGNFYRKFIENGFLAPGARYMDVPLDNNGYPILAQAKLVNWSGTGNDLKNTYAARWICKVTF